MITYVDTSVLLKLIVDEQGSDRAALIWSTADAVASVSLISVEARAAIAAAGRGRRLTAAQVRDAHAGVADAREPVPPLAWSRADGPWRRYM